MSDPGTGPLAQRICVPCRGGVPILTREAAERLRAEVPDWTLEDEAHRIERRFRFKGFGAAFAFVSRVAAIAEEEGHHPDISFGWGYATVTLQTKVIGGLHVNDFIVAAKIDGLFGTPSA